MNPITWLLSKVTGLPEPTLRLLMTVALGYPVANMYNKRFNSDDAEGSTKEERNFFILCAGLGLNFFFNMTSIYHTLVTVGLSYGICCFFQSNRKLAAAGVWVLNATYLMAGYFFMQTDDYDITWTMTQCILCLRMMAFGFDFYDGEKKVKVAGPPSKTDLKQDNDVNKAAIRPTEQKKTPAALPLSFGIDTPLMELPSFVEVLAFANFPSAFLVGPQFSFSLYKKWLETLPTAFSFQERDERDRARNAYVIRCAALAVLYLGLQQTIGAAYSTSYLLTEEYRSHGFLARCVLFAIAGKFAYNKYIGIWLLTEGATASFGISYEGFDEEGLALYGGLANALPATYETATSIDHIISAFNINTNLWSKYYVFKRLKFLGNKQASQAGTLAFLALWHGYHPMYFITFLLEYLYVQCEMVLRKRLSPVVRPYTEKNPIAMYGWKAVSWIACQLCVTYAVVGFELLNFGKAMQAYKSVWFLGHLIIPVILVGNNFLPKVRTTPIKKTQ